MDSSTRIGLGGTALFTLAGVGAPLLTWWVSGPIMLLCALVAVWGLWPAMADAKKRLLYSAGIGDPPPSKHEARSIPWNKAVSLMLLIAAVGFFVWWLARGSVSSYAYLKAFPDDLTNHKLPIEMWVCATGPLLGVRIHPYTYGLRGPVTSSPNDPYYSMKGAIFNYLNPGCRVTPISLPLGKWSIDLEATNGLVRQTIEFRELRFGRIEQSCSLERTSDGTALEAPLCNN
jgi:hypothetical protein